MLTIGKLHPRSFQRDKITSLTSSAGFSNIVLTVGGIQFDKDDCFGVLNRRSVHDVYLFAFIQVIASLVSDHGLSVFLIIYETRLGIWIQATMNDTLKYYHRLHRLK